MGRASNRKWAKRITGQSRAKVDNIKRVDKMDRKADVIAAKLAKGVQS